MSIGSDVVDSLRSTRRYSSSRQLVKSNQSSIRIGTFIYNLEIICMTCFLNVVHRTVEICLETLNIVQILQIE